MEVLRAKNLSKTFKSGKIEVHALKNINLVIESGEFVSIIGPSGSGKSTLLHILGGVDTPTEGEVYYDGIPLSTLNDRELSIFRRRKIGFIFQFFNLIPVLSAQENILLPILLDERKADEQFIEEIISVLNLGDRLGFYPEELSGGQKQRVAIGRSLIAKPSIVLADEPTGNLDSKNSQEVIDLLKLSVNKYKQTVVLITHDLNIAAQADRVIRLEDGQIISDTKNGG